MIPSRGISAAVRSTAMLRTSHGGVGDKVSDLVAGEVLDNFPGEGSGDEAHALPSFLVPEAPEPTIASGDEEGPGDDDEV